MPFDNGRRSRYGRNRSKLNPVGTLARALPPIQGFFKRMEVDPSSFPFSVKLLPHGIAFRLTMLRRGVRLEGHCPNGNLITLAFDAGIAMAGSDLDYP